MPTFTYRLNYESKDRLGLVHFVLINYLVDKRISSILDYHYRAVMLLMVGLNFGFLSDFMTNDARFKNLKVKTCFLIHKKRDETINQKELLYRNVKNLKIVLNQVSLLRMVKLIKSYLTPHSCKILGPY